MKLFRALYGKNPLRCWNGFFKKCAENEKTASTRFLLHFRSAARQLRDCLSYWRGLQHAQ
jgi:hypothetical protein